MQPRAVRIAVWLTVVLTTWGASGIRAQTEVIRLGVYSLPGGTPASRGAEVFRNQVNKRLEGRARIEVVTLPLSTNAVNALHAGEVDLALVPSSALAAAKMPTMALFDLPFFFKDIQELSAVQRSRLGGAMLNATNVDRLVGLTYWNTGMSKLFGYKKVERVEDLKGLKFRTTVSPSARAAIESMGAVTTQIPFSEVHSALQRGQIDVVEAPPVFVGPGRVFSTDSVRTYTNVNYRPIVSVLVASEKFWEQARYRTQTALVDEAKEIARRVDTDAIGADESATARLRRDLEVISFTAQQFDSFSHAAQPSWRNVEPLQKDKFLDVAIGARDELRRVQHKPAPKPSAASKGSIAAVHFATDRVDEKDEPAFRFGGKRGTLVWGRANVHVDPQRNTGEASRVKLSNLDAYDGDTKRFLAAVKRRVDHSRAKAILLYVHGYNNSFSYAAETAAQIATDTKFDGATVLFSWPSDGAVARYPSDEEEVQSSRDNFITALRVLAQIDTLKRINVLTHSMGGRLAASSLEWLSVQPTKPRPNLYHLILAAPDIRITHFTSAAPRMQGLSKKLTLYSSKWDQALQCSLWFHGGPRAGQAGANLVVLKDIDTVDVSAVETQTLWDHILSTLPCTPAGHSYISHNPAVLSDLYELLAYDANPERRQRLRAGEKNGLPYWILR